MTQHLTVQELAIAIAAENLNPTAVNPDFLKYSDIVPEEWELARPPVYTNQLVQLVFQSGVAIVAQPNRIIFLEAINEKEQSAVQVARIADRYVAKLPNVEYQAVGINPKGYVTMAGTDEAHRFLTEQILAAGSWQKIGRAPVKAAVQLAYTLERGQLNLTINEAALQLPEAEPVPAVLFSGNFNYEVVGSTRDARSQEIQGAIQDWQVALQVFGNLINQHFLQQPIVAEAG
jgi:hypothetical protein